MKFGQTFISILFRHSPGSIGVLGCFQIKTVNGDASTSTNSVQSSKKWLQVLSLQPSQQRNSVTHAQCHPLSLQSMCRLHGLFKSSTARSRRYLPYFTHEIQLETLAAENILLSCNAKFLNERIKNERQYEVTSPQCFRYEKSVNNGEPLIFVFRYTAIQQHTCTPIIVTW
ncbi:hypothetical protein M758_7G009800 [Ceratodon purpureus]|nr:hypothetical protein M758_7G009800 [Ceratodon purpureus]